jgi:hypothetical protein
MTGMAYGGVKGLVGAAVGHGEDPLEIAQDSEEEPQEMVKKKGVMAPSRRPDVTDDDVAYKGSKPHRNADPGFWEQQSPNEIRAQMVIRGVSRREMANMHKQDLVNLAVRVNRK